MSATRAVRPRSRVTRTSPPLQRMQPARLHAAVYPPARWTRWWDPPRSDAVREGSTILRGAVVQRNSEWKRLYRRLFMRWTGVALAPRPRLARATPPWRFGELQHASHAHRGRPGGASGTPPHLARRHPRRGHTLEDAASDPSGPDCRRGRGRGFESPCPLQSDFSQLFSGRAAAALGRRFRGLLRAYLDGAQADRRAETPLRTSETLRTLRVGQFYPQA